MVIEGCRRLTRGRRSLDIDLAATSFSDLDRPHFRKDWTPWSAAGQMHGASNIGPHIQEAEWPAFSSSMASHSSTACRTAAQTVR